MKLLDLGQLEMEWRSFKIVDPKTHEQESKRLLLGEARTDIYVVWPDCHSFNLKLRFGEYLELKTLVSRDETTGVEMWTRSKRIRCKEADIETIRDLLVKSGKKKFLKAAEHSSSSDLSSHHMVHVKKVVQKRPLKRGWFEESALEVTLSNGKIIHCITTCFEGQFSDANEMTTQGDVAEKIAGGDFIGSYNAFLLHLLRERPSADESAFKKAKANVNVFN